MKRFHQILAVAALACAIVSCGGDNDRSRATTIATPVTHAQASPKLAVTPFPGPTPTEMGMYLPGTRAGNAKVDTILGLYERKDIEGLDALLLYRPLPCVATLDRRFPQCSDGIALGTPISGVETGGCEGGVRSRDFVRVVLQGRVREMVYLFGVYQAPGFGQPEKIETVILMGHSPQDKSPWRIPLDANGTILRIEDGCGGYNVPDTGFTWILEPKAPG